ncbi:MAG: hypothetical protein Tsb0016_12920 [Sphingomonadales bacterium]
MQIIKGLTVGFGLAAAALVAACASDAPLNLNFEQPAPIAARAAPIHLTDARANTLVGLRAPGKPASEIRLAGDFLDRAAEFWNAGADAGAGMPHDVSLQSLRASHRDKNFGDDFRMEIALADATSGRASRCEQTVRAFPKLDAITIEDMASELIVDCLNRLFAATPEPSAP